MQSLPQTSALSLAPPDERPRVLVVDDEKLIRDILAEFLSLEGYVVETAEDGSTAMRELQRASFDMIISDLKMPRMGGLELLREVSRVHPDTLTVIMTGFGTVETAIDAMKRGAYDYILKPFKVEEILHIVQRGLEKRRLAAENLRLREALSLYKVSEAIAASLSLEEVMSTVSSSALHELRADAVCTWLDDGEGSYFERSVEFASSVAADRARCDLASEAVTERLVRGGPVVEHGQRALEFFRESQSMDVSSLLVVPLKMRERLIGWIGAVSLTATKRFDEGQRKMLSIIASRAAAAIENARLYHDLQTTFQQTIQSLANTIDKMDRYTSGHSERVSRYAVALARWLGLKAELVEVVRQSALMHDIGKV
ncbi:MAG TPA: response regulator, partial [Polyangiaceae bacterium]